MSNPHTYLKYFIIILSIFTFKNALSYTMPVGIPNPTIDFEQPAPIRPSDWDTEVAGYYYIDMKNGSTSLTYGTPISPRKYLPSPIPAGSYIEIKGDLKQGSGGYYKLIANGTNESWVANVSGPVWITKAQEGTGAFIENRLILTGSNIFITDLDFTNGGRPQVGSSSTGYDISNLVIRNSDISANKAIGIGISVNHAENIVIYNNKIHDLGDINADYDQDSHVVTVGAYTANIWQLNNEMYNASGSGLQVNGEAVIHTTENIYVADNEVYNVRQSGLWLKSGKNVVFSTNYVHDILTTAWSPAKGIGAQYTPENFWIINNHIEGVEHGILTTSYNTLNSDKYNPTFECNTYIIGNIIHNIESKQSSESIALVGSNNSWQSSAITVVGGHKIFAYNNLIFNATNGIVFGTTSEIYVKNNIIFDLNVQHEEGLHGKYIWSEFVGFNGKLNISNNYFDNDMNVRVKSQVYNSADTLNTSGGLNNIKGETFLSGNDIEDILNSKSLSNNNISEITDKGANISDIIYTLYKETFDITIATDILTSNRIQGKAIDIGPFETSGSSEIVDSSLPLVPTILEIIKIK